MRIIIALLAQAQELLHAHYAKTNFLVLIAQVVQLIVRLALVPLNAVDAKEITLERYIFFN